MGVYINRHRVILPSKFSGIEVSVSSKLKFNSGEFELDLNSEYYPNRSDLKIMRGDVIASIIATNEMLAGLDSREDLSLFVSSGVFIENVEKHLGSVLKSYEQFIDIENEAERMRKLYRSSPPLLALQTLTNSAMSFIAQYTGIKGNNATYGNTSLSGFHAIREGIQDVSYNSISAVIASSNIGGPQSFLMNLPFYKSQGEWKEGSAAGSMYLSNRSEKALAEIVHFESNESNIDFDSTEINRNWKSIIPDESSEAIIYGGSFNSEENNLDREYCQAIQQNVFSTFDKWGNLGSANMTIGISEGINLLQTGINSIDILDRDIFGRESAIRIVKCQ